MKIKSTFAGVTFAAFSLVTPIAFAAVSGTANTGYVADSKGNLVNDGYGHCVRTSQWDKSLALSACDPSLVVKAPETTPSTLLPNTSIAATEPEPKPEKITLTERPLFSIDQAQIDSRYSQNLGTLAEQVKGLSEIEQIEVTGHADNTGSSEHNMALSLRRAENVKKFLIDSGISEDRIVIKGMGETQPVANNQTIDGRALNRRVEVEIKGERIVDSGNKL